MNKDKKLCIVLATKPVTKTHLLPVSCYLVKYVALLKWQHAPCQLGKSLALSQSSICLADLRRAKCYLKTSLRSGKVCILARKLTRKSNFNVRKCWTSGRVCNNATTVRQCLLVALPPPPFTQNLGQRSRQIALFAKWTTIAMRWQPWPMALSCWW